MPLGSKLNRWQFVALAIGAYLVYVGLRASMSFWSSGKDAAVVREIVATEELILELTPKLKRLTSGVLNLQLPDYQGHLIFEPTVVVKDIGSEHEQGRDVVGQLAIVESDWPVATSSQAIPREELRIWQPLLSSIDFFEHAKFYFVDGRFLDEELEVFEADFGFKALARNCTGHESAIKGSIVVQWRRQKGNKEQTAPSWLIHSFETVRLHTIQTPRQMFTETLDQNLPRDSDHQLARTSHHEQQIIEYYEGGAQVLPYSYFSPISANLKPGLSVVDIDGDGFDDLYVTVRAGRNQLLRNKRDGTFEEVAREYGVDIEGHSNCAIFADFDNDDDQDLMLGRSLERSMYFENLGGYFKPRDQMRAGEPILPHLAVSMSAADYNGDGLLDLYVCTYRPAMLENIVSHEQTLHVDEDSEFFNSLDGITSQSKKWPDQFLSEHQARDYYLRVEKSSRGRDEYSNVLDQVGPPNLLLVNRGNGQFEVAPENRTLGIWRNSLQATWCDFDEDGDPDLYVANDWARDHLFRNDGSLGFVDVTDQLGTNEFGFAMGATWGDFDNDGSHDLYVSNMYSKAGRRITRRIAELNPEYQRSVEGNYLYRQESGKFQLVSGLEDPALKVAEAGWSWGGQFADFNNDGFLDLYVLSGYFTAPTGFDSQIDL